LAKVALVVGATGLIGNELVQLLLKDEHYGRVVVFVRKLMNVQHQKLEQEIVDFDRLDQVAHYLEGADVFCTLGTTIKKAGSKSAFTKVDQQYPLRLAQLSKKQGADSFLIVTALGADPKSSIFYNQVKGQLEVELQKLQLGRLHIFQPSLLLGDREEFRLGEKITTKLISVMPFLFIGPLRKYKPIHVHTVAKSMIQAARSARLGSFTYTSQEIASSV